MWDMKIYNNCEGLCRNENLKIIIIIPSHAKATDTATNCKRRGEQHNKFDGAAATEIGFLPIGR